VEMIVEMQFDWPCI